MTRVARLIACWVLLAPLGCTVGQGEGQVESKQLYVDGCWNGAFKLGPDFFGANPDKGVSLMIRLQRGDNIEDVSDGLSVTVNDLQEIRKHLGEEIPVGMPRGVAPPGVPVVQTENPPKVSLSLYLHNTCHQQNGTIYSVAGSINFSKLFSGDLNEGSSENRHTVAKFDASFADPRELAEAVGDQAKAEVTSNVTGYFDFFFQRGQPSQPFE